MVPDQHRHVAGFRRLAQAQAGFERVRDGLLHQRGHPGGDAGQRLVGVHLVRARQDHAVGAVAGEQLGEGSEERHAQTLREVGRRGSRVGDRRQRASVVLDDEFDVPLADLAGARDCNANFGSGHD